MTKEENRQMFADTVRVCQKGSFFLNGQEIPLNLTAEQMQEAHVFLPDDIEQLQRTAKPSRPDHPGCTLACWKKDSFGAAAAITAERLKLGESAEKPVLVLNMANSLSPGAGMKFASNTQEEGLCRQSTLYQSLSSPSAKSYYEWNKKQKQRSGTELGTDAIILSPHVEILKNAKGEYLPQSVTAAVLSCAAPNLSHGLQGLCQQEYEALMYSRIRAMLTVAAAEGYQDFVLGAFGCGSFKNDAKVVSALFYKAVQEFSLNGLRTNALFRRIIFAIISHTQNSYGYDCFSEYFPSEKPAQQHEAEVPAALQAGLVLEQDTLQVNGRTMPAYFFHDEDQPNGFMSNWYPSAFTLDGLQFSSAEQYIMYRKCMVFADADRAAAVLAADTPAEQKDIARNTEYNEKVWNGIRQPAAMRGLQAKFSQNPILLQALLDTGDAYLVECSRNDKTWACGITIRDKSKTYRNIDNWKGKNILGFALMEIRTALRQQHDADAENSCRE